MNHPGLLTLAALLAASLATAFAPGQEITDVLANRGQLRAQWSAAVEAGRDDEAVRLGERIAAIEGELLERVRKEIPDADPRKAGIVETIRGWRIDSVSWLADRYEADDEWEPAVAARRALVPLAEAAYGERDWRAGDARRALTDAERRRDLSPADRERLAEADRLNRQAVELYRAGRYVEAEPPVRRALELRRGALGDDHPDYALALNNLAALCEDQGRYAEAEPLYKKALEIMKAARGEEHPDYADSLNNLAFLYSATGRSAEAEPLYQGALEVYRKALGEGHPDYAAGLNNLAALYAAGGRYPEAEPLFRRAAEVKRAAFGEDHPEYALGLNNLAFLYNATGREAEAEPLYRQALEIWQAALGEAHPDYALGLNNLAEFYREAGRDAEAEPLFGRAAEIWKAALGGDHPHYATSLYNLAFFRHARGRYGEAGVLFDRARRPARRHAAATLAGLAEREQLDFLATEDGNLHAALSLAVAAGAEAPNLAALSAGWSLNGKALAAEELAERARLARLSADPAAAETVRGLLAVRSELARRTLAGPGPEGPDAYRARLAELVAEETDLSKELYAFRGEAAREDPWVELEEVRAALPAGGVLVEFARFVVYDVKENTLRDPRYAAWLVPPAGAGEVRLVDLGPAGPLEAAVAEAHDAAARGREDRARRKLAAVSKLVLEPLLPELSGSPRWYLSPDAALWLVPFCALPLPDGRYAVEAHEITLLTSGRELVAGRRTGGGPNAEGGLLVADPDFDAAGPATTPEPKADVLLAAADPAAGRRAAGPLPRFAPLPGTAAEAEAVRPALAAYLGGEPQALLGTEATESAVKGIARPRALVLATHGFALPAPERDIPADSVFAARGLTPFGAERPKPHSPKPSASVISVVRYAGPAIENPLLRCGVALAGANTRIEEGGPAEDGILTGLEVAGLDLRGTELVVLSACQTGLGDVRTGEGVADLRHAFRLAGARAVVASLWEVPDAETADLMARFWRELAEGREPAAALRAAQLGLLKELREQGDARPALWAAFSVTGPPRLEADAPTTGGRDAGDGP